MRKVYFQYRDVGAPEMMCLLKATHDDGRHWEEIVGIPYPLRHEFWLEDAYSSWVTRVSRKLAREHKAPDWVFE